MTARTEAPARPAVGALSLRRNFSWTLAGNVVYAGCQWGMLVVLAKLGTPEMVGQFALGLAVTAPVIMFANLQLRAVQATDAKREYRFGDYLALRLLTTALALAVIAGIVAAAGYRRETALVILAVGLAKAVESISDVYYGLFQQHERMDRIAGSLMMRGPLALGALTLSVSRTGGVLWGVLGMALAWSGVLLAHDARASREIADPLARKPRWRGRVLLRLARLALPLGIVMMLISLNANIPRYFVEHYLGEEALGIFAAMAYLMTAGGMVMNALGQSASPRLARHYAEGNREAFRALLLKLAGLALLLGGTGLLAAAVAGRQVLTLLYGAAYGAWADLLIWIMVAAAFTYLSSAFGYAATARRWLNGQPLVLGAVAAVSVLACTALVPGSGLQGAAIATLLASATAAVLYAIGPAMRRRGG